MGANTEKKAAEAVAREKLWITAVKKLWLCVLVVVPLVLIPALIYFMFIGRKVDALSCALALGGYVILIMLLAIRKMVHSEIH